MVGQLIMKADNLYTSVRDNMNLIEPEWFDQFVASTILWYQREISHPTVYFYDKELWPTKPPNIFNLFEYPDQTGEVIFGHFLKSITHRLKDEGAAITTLNEVRSQEVGLMMEDVYSVFDAYRLFYCYQDETTAGTFYYNPYVKEVW